MMRHNVKLTSQDLGLLLKFLIFETTKRALAISFVQRLRLEGRIPDLKVWSAMIFTCNILSKFCLCSSFILDEILDASLFHDNGRTYLLHWSCLLTEELLAEVQEVEKSHLQQRALYTGDVFVEEEQEGRETILKVLTSHDMKYCLSKWFNATYPTVLVKRLEVSWTEIARNLLNISHIWSRDLMHTSWNFD